LGNAKADKLTSEIANAMSTVVECFPLVTQRKFNRCKDRNWHGADVAQEKNEKFFWLNEGHTLCGCWFPLSAQEAKVSITAVSKHWCRIFACLGKGS